MKRMTAWGAALAAAAVAAPVPVMEGAAIARTGESAMCAAPAQAAPVASSTPAGGLPAPAAMSPEAGGSPGPHLTGECVLYFERGHYWIELSLPGTAAGADAPAPARAMFEIAEIASGERFNPSRVELVADDEGQRYIVLSSGRLRGKRCYIVVFDPGGPGERTLGPACDPFAARPDAAGGRGRFFARHIAPAFRVSGQEYRFNRLSIKYDLSAEKAVTALDIEPVFELGAARLTPFFKHDATTYIYPDRPGRAVSRRRAGCSAAAAVWTGGVRAGIEGEFVSDRRSVAGPAGDETSLAATARVIGRVRLDNLFDRLNRHGISVFKGVDAGIGHAWYTPAGASGMESFDLRAPLATARLTWTLLSGVQLSYEAETSRPAGETRWHAWQRFRARLLLRDALAPPTGRTYHPDLEFALDTGRRPPFFERERSVSLGFTFNLYPW